MKHYMTRKAAASKFNSRSRLLLPSISIDGNEAVVVRGTREGGEGGVAGRGMVLGWGRPHAVSAAAAAPPPLRPHVFVRRSILAVKS